MAFKAEYIWIDGTEPSPHLDLKLGYYRMGQISQFGDLMVQVLTKHREKTRTVCYVLFFPVLIQYQVETTNWSCAKSYCLI